MLLRLHRHYFNPLPSCEGRPSGQQKPPADSNFNPLPSCEGRLIFSFNQLPLQLISIHSPHARGDRTKGDGSR